MSTKASIKLGADWHLYRETLDGSIHLEIEGDDLEFEVSPGHIDIKIPEDVVKTLNLDCL